MDIKDELSIKFDADNAAVMEVVWQVWKATAPISIDNPGRDFSQVRADWENHTIKLIVLVDLVRAGLLEAGLYTVNNRIPPQARPGWADRGK